ncbi:MAG: cell division protein ZipA [Porticoccaceae bacterium]
MDFGPREVLIALGALLVCGIILDGVRRMRAARRGSLRGPRRQSIFDDDSQSATDHDNDELPGSVRVVAIRDEQATAELNQSLRQRSDATFTFRTKPYRREPGPEQGRDELVPDPSLSVDQVSVPDPAAEPGPEPLATTGDILIPEREPDVECTDRLELDVDDLPLFRGEPAPNISISAEKSARSTRGGRRRGRASTEADPATKDVGETDAVVIHLMAPPGQTFSARPLFAALLNAGLKFGERNIFHSYDDAGTSNGEPVARFSVANALKPGAFEGSLHEFSTPGVAFFMLINDQPDPLAVFDDMLASAQAAARELDAELKDEQRATLTRSGIAHYRQRILDYSRRHGLRD